MAPQVFAPPERSRRRRPLLGLRETPGRLALAVFRIPLLLYRRGWGWMLDRTFLLLVHTGRKTGRLHQTVAMVLANDPSSGEVVICSGWGPNADWVHNLRARPAREVHLGRARFVPEHRFLTEDEAVAVVREFRRRHPRRVWLITKVLGWGDLKTDNNVRAFVQRHPFVALRPVQQSSNDTKECQ